MGSQRLAAIAAASHARHFNHTAEVLQTDVPQYSVNVLFISATLCGVLVAVCAACWRRSPPVDKPVEDAAGVYTVSADHVFTQVPDDMTGPPPAYETVVDDPNLPKDCVLEEVVTECPRCISSSSGRPDNELPSYEAAVMLKDTRL